ncbi:MAG: hypothetical protein BAA04_07100 [Firmicutes bacterium ZCTH02-B6]|nr:MAG: hypothetical protein BAA04_07100 [Firmicutes bacterium ZCTH02-B6]
MTQFILGIDPGFGAMGMAVVDVRQRTWAVVHSRAVRTQRSTRKTTVRVADDDAERARQLAAALHEVIREYRPMGAIVELPNGGARGARAARALGIATGVVVAVLHVAGLPVEWVTPADVKSVAGTRNASKADVQEAVRRLLSWPVGWPEEAWAQEHIADAAAAVLAAETGTLVRMVQRGTLLQTLERVMGGGTA